MTKEGETYNFPCINAIGIALFACVSKIFVVRRQLASLKNLDRLSFYSIYYLSTPNDMAISNFASNWFLIQGLYLEVCHSIQHHGLRRRLLEFP